MDEKIFLDKIDCNFPYLDRRKSSNLIKEALNYSPNAIYTIVEEIARIPFNERSKVSKLRLTELLSEIDRNFEHGLKRKLLEVANKMVNFEEIEINIALNLMDEVKSEKYMWGALSMMYFSCTDQDDKLEDKYYEIREFWNK